MEFNENFDIREDQWDLFLKACEYFGWNMDQAGADHFNDAYITHFDSNSDMESFVVDGYYEAMNVPDYIHAYINEDKLAIDCLMDYKIMEPDEEDSRYHLFYNY